MARKDDFPTLLDNLMQELRRGFLVLATLSQLREAKYGYDLISHLRAQGLEVEQGTLYPLLRRLEGQGLLESEWNVDGSRPRRYYKISPTGVEVLVRLSEDWHEMTAVMDSLLQDQNEGREEAAVLNTDQGNEQTNDADTEYAEDK